MDGIAGKPPGLVPTHPDAALQVPLENDASTGAPASTSSTHPTPVLSDPAAAQEDAVEEVFKVPSLPFPSLAATNSSMTGLPADIEHILSLGANERDPNEDLETGEVQDTSNFEEVVRKMKEKAGFADEKVEGDSTMEIANEETHATELAAVEKEMELGGVSRRQVEREEGGEESSETATATTDDVRMEDGEPISKMDESSSEASSSDSDSTDSDAAVAEAMRPTSVPPSTTTTRPHRRGRGNRAGKQAAADSGSDLSDDDINSTSLSAPKTEHEVAQPEIELPEIQKLPEDAEIARFGKVESVIDSVVVVKADTAGDWRVLDEGSLCVWQDKTVIGKIFETFGSVQQPYYSLRFPPSALPSPEVFTIGKAVFYCPKLASFVFTRDIRGIKGSDASNVWDEEVNTVAEMEFSDDEAEQNFKRNLKADRRSRTASVTPGPQSRQGSRAPSVSLAPHDSLPSRPGPPPLPYDSDIYAPIARPRGEAPQPHLEAGRTMFERPAGRVGGVSAQEYDYSDEEGETGSISSTFETDERYVALDLEREREREDERRERERTAGRGGRGRGARGRGGASGRGGNSDGGNRGRGGRGGFENRRGGGDGAGRGPSTPTSSRPVAPLPRSLPKAPIGLPPKPDFVPSDLDLNSLGGTPPGPMVFGAGSSASVVEPFTFQPGSGSAMGSPYSENPPSRGYGAPRQDARQDQQQQQRNPAHPPYLPHQQPSYPNYPPQNAYPPFNGPGVYGNGNFNNYQPSPYPPTYPQRNQPSYPSPPPSFVPNSAGPIALQGGHFNPRFLGNPAFPPPPPPPAGGSGGAPPSTSAYGNGGYPGQQGYAYPQYGISYPNNTGQYVARPPPGPGTQERNYGWQAPQGQRPEQRAPGDQQSGGG